MDTTGTIEETAIQINDNKTEQIGKRRKNPGTARQRS